MVRSLYLGSSGALLVVAFAGCGSHSPAESHGDAQAPEAAAGPPRWTWRNVNLQGMGDVNGLVVHPDTVHAPNLLYARTNVGGVYRRDPNSAAWIPLLDAFGPLQANDYYVESVAVDPNVPDDVYIVVDGQTRYTPGCTVDPGQVLVSHDRGATWASTGSFGAYVFSNDSHGDTTGERLMVDPNKPGLLFFASHKDGLWRGSVGAWSNAVGAGLPPDTCSLDCNLTCDPTCPPSCSAGESFVVFDKASGTTADGATRRMFVGVWTTGVFVSDDGGQTFASIGADAHPVRGSVGLDGTLYVTFGQPEAPPAGSGGVRAYALDASGSWSDTDVTPPAGTGVSYSGVSADPSNAGTVLVTTNDARIFRSTNGGASWTAIRVTIGSAPPWYWDPYWYKWGGALVVDPNDPSGNTVWRTDGFAVSRTTDAAQGLWSTAMDGLEELVGTVVRSPGSPGGPSFYAGVADALGFADRDPSQPPAQNLAAPGGDVAEATSFDICASQPQVAAFVGWDEAADPTTPVTGITTNGGASFTPFANSEPGYGGAIAIAANDPSNFVWEPANGAALVYSTDAGQTWTASALVAEAGPPGPSFYRSSQWFKGQTVASDRKAPNTFYYLSQSQGQTPSIHFWSSTDGGKTFADLGASFRGAPLYTSAPMIKPNPATAGDIWVTLGYSGTEIGALYRSQNGGATFEKVSSVGAAYQVAFGKGASGSLPAIYLFGRMPGSSLDVMFQSEDLGANWNAISDPSANGFGEISYLEGDMSVANLVYVALAGRGIMVGTAGAAPTPDDAGSAEAGREAGPARDAAITCPAVTVTNPVVTAMGTSSGTTLMFGSGTDEWGAYTYAATNQAPPVIGLTADAAGIGISGALAGPANPGQNYVGAGLYYYSTGCLDASSYTGISFDFSGDLGGCSLVFAVAFSADENIAYDAARGTCTAGSSGCIGPFTDVTGAALAATPATPTLRVPFSSLSGGMPIATCDPSTLITMEWQLEAGADGGGCSAQLSIENVSFFK
jgi:hypothetical protein